MSSFVLVGIIQDPLTVKTVVSLATGTEYNGRTVLHSRTEESNKSEGVCGTRTNDYDNTTRRPDEKGPNRGRGESQ